MNIFIMILVVLFMGTYYLISSPAMRIQEQETTQAIERADLRAVADCAVAAHNATIRGGEFPDPCVAQNNISSRTVCLTAAMATTKCDGQRNKKPAYSYFITTTGELSPSDYNGMLEILETHYPDAGTLGIFMENQILSGASGKRAVPTAVADQAELTDGQLVYLTRYEIPDADAEFSAPNSAGIECPAGTVKTYRFGRWQCIGYNMKTNCAGDMIWDSDLLECVPDESRKPLCASQQTAVMVDDVWECINPFPDKNCGNGLVMRLNYNTLEWECVADPSATPETKKCTNIVAGAIYGHLGATLRRPSTSCTDCEIMLTDEETCTSVCVPDTSRINDAKCYPGGAEKCTGAGRGFYFGFPNAGYAANIPELRGKQIPIDRTHSQNRKFNCMECGERGINQEKSFPPYITICN